MRQPARLGIKILIALTLASVGAETSLVLGYGSTEGFVCWTAPIQGGADEIDAVGMPATPIWGRLCQSAPKVAH